MSKQLYKVKLVQGKKIGPNLEGFSRRDLGWKFLEQLYPEKIIEREELQKQYPLFNSIEYHQKQIKKILEWKKMHHGRKVRDFRLVEVTISIKEIPLNKRPQKPKTKV